MREYALANLYGAIGWFEGPLIRNHPTYGGKIKLIPDEYSLQMTSVVPSRLGLARPFLFDDSFHLLVLCQQQSPACIEVFQSWFYTMTADGHIAKEQARGPDALFGIPEQYVGVDPNTLTPPIFLIVLRYLLESRESQEYDVLYQGFAKHYTWYKRNAENQPMLCTFSYKQRTGDSCEESQMEDYPRGATANKHYEAHLDLQSMMVYFAETMEIFALKLGRKLDALAYRADADCFSQKLHEHMYSEITGLYADHLGMQFKPEVKDREPITWRLDMRCGSVFNSLGSIATCENPANQKNCCMDGRCIEDAECDGGTLYPPLAAVYKNSRSLHKGFVSLYPLMFGQIEDPDLVS